MYTKLFQLLTVALIACNTLAAARQFDDETTQNKLQLEDIENEQEQIELRQEQEQQQQLQQRTHLYKNPTKATPHIVPATNRRQPYIPLHYAQKQYKRPQQQISSIANIRPFRVGIQSVEAEQQQPAAANQRYTIGVNPYYSQTNNNIDDDDDDNDADHNDLAVRQRKQQLQYVQSALKNERKLAAAPLSAGYNIQQPALGDDAFVLMPPFNAPKEIYAPLPSQIPAPPMYLDRLPVNSKFLAFPMNEPQANSIKYLTNNEISPNAAAETAAAIEYAYEQQLANSALTMQRPPAPTTQQLLHTRQQYATVAGGHRRPALYALQSNQFAYAPAHPDRGPLPADTLAIPYPPSFISITTERPAASNLQAGAATLYGRPRDFNPAAVEPMPDFFANSRAKSLLDSYIPSWEIARMLQAARETQYKRHAKRGATLSTEKATKLINTKDNDVVQMNA